MYCLPGWCRLTSLGARVVPPRLGPVQDSDAPSPVRSADPSPLPQLLCHELSSFPNFLKAVHVNAQSLLCHIDEFRSIFETPKFDVILVSETWLKPGISDKSVELSGYNLLRNDRTSKRGGGVAMYLKSHLPSTVLKSSDSSRSGYAEYRFTDICVNGTHALIAVCYRAPSLGHPVEFEHVLIDLMARYCHVIVMGDFNSDLLGPVTYDQTYLTTMFRSCNMTLLPLQATHHTATADTWLDVIAVTDLTHVAHHGQYPAPGLSKHDLIFCVYRLSLPKPKPQFIQFRNFKAINYDNLISHSRLMAWDEIILAPDVNQMVHKFNYLLCSLFDKHAPVITKRVQKRPCPWMSDLIKQMQKKRDSAFRKAKKSKFATDWASYKRLRNRTQQEIRNAKIRYYYIAFSDNSHSTKSLWSKVKELGIGKSITAPPVTTDLNIINDYFVNIPIDLTGASDYIAELQSVPSERPYHQFCFTPVSDADVLGAILRVTSNAVGADKIPIRLIKYTLPVILPVITAIFNKSLSSSTFPSVWKLAFVRPLQKKASPQLPSDFRPISILSALSKCLERLVHRQIVLFIQTNNILSNFQSGFRSSHSTTSALLKITDDIRSAMDKKLVTILTLFDFSKAFDCVFHPLLLHKLLKIGFSDMCVDWVRSYLSERQQCVKTGCDESLWRPVTRGVPQGSVLGPLLFSLYIDDITAVIRYSKVHMYADDLQIYHHFPTNEFDLTVFNMNIDITAISTWAFNHGLKLNESKTQAILLGYPRLTNKINLNTSSKLVLNNHQLEFCDKIKNLGLTLTKTLSWTEQITQICNRVFAGIHSLKRFALYLPLSMKVLLVKTLIFPHFNYCDVVISDMTVELSERLQRAQNYCLRFIFNLRRRDHVTQFFEQLSILKLNELRKYHILCTLHSILLSKSPAYLSEKFLFISDISTRSTRHGSSLLYIPHHRTSFFNKSFTVSACRLWNNLPENIRVIDRRARFRAEVWNFLLRDSRA